MYNYKNEYKSNEYENYEFENEAAPAYENEYEDEAGLNAGYQGEAEGEYEDEYQYEDEYDNETENEDFENEYDNEYENEMEGEDYEGPDFEDEIRVHDHRTVRTYTRPGYASASRPTSYTPPRGVMRVPTRPGRPIPNRYTSQRPANQSSSWYNRYRRPVAWPFRYNSYPVNRHPHRHYWRNRFGSIPYNGVFSNIQMGSQGYPEMTSQPYPNTTVPNAATGSPLPQQADSGFQNYVLETLKSISNQLAASNESINSLKSSSVNNTAQHSGISQPSDPPLPNAGADTIQPPANTEFEMENYEFQSEYEEEVPDREGSFTETREMELASELLNINNETELNYFIGSLIKKAAGAVTGILKTPQGKLLAGLLKNVAKKALPLAGAAAGTYFGGPAGAKIGLSAGDAASKMFELEFEGLSNEDQEFESARAVVRLSGNAARQLTEQDTGDPQEDARQALIQASMLYAPGLIVHRSHRHRRFHGGSRRRF